MLLLIVDTKCSFNKEKALNLIVTLHVIRKTFRYWCTHGNIRHQPSSLDPLATVEYHQNSPKSFTAAVPWATTSTRQVPIRGLDTNCSQVFKFHHISANKPEKHPLNSSW